MIEEKRIYIVVAETVQNPMVCDKNGILSSTHETKTIVQPIGRIGAQIAHVAGIMHDHTNTQDDLQYRVFTTIILAVPDSYQLEFRHTLLVKAGLRTHFFRDTNEEYGCGEVKTAVCTEPVTRKQLKGALDYLPLWGGGTSEPRRRDSMHPLSQPTLGMPRMSRRESRKMFKLRPTVSREIQQRQWRMAVCE